MNPNLILEQLACMGNLSGKITNCDCSDRKTPFNMSL